MKRSAFFMMAVLGFAAMALPRTGFAQAPAAPAAPAANAPIKLTMADGRVVPVLGMRRSKDTLLVTVNLAAGVRGDVGYPIATVKKIEMAEPAQLKTGRALLAAGKFAEALAQINIIEVTQGDLRQIPGNWWAPAALLKVDALLGLNRDREAEMLVNSLAANSQDPQTLQNARMALAELWARTGRVDEANAVFDKVIAESTDARTVARAWRNKGDALFAKHDYDGALIAYLRVPIFYPDQTAILPSALLGSARSYEGLADYDSASETLAELTKKFAASPEAAQAKNDSARIEKKRNPDSAEPAATPAP